MSKQNVLLCSSVIAPTIWGKHLKFLLLPKRTAIYIWLLKETIRHLMFHIIFFCDLIMIYLPSSAMIPSWFPKTLSLVSLCFSLWILNITRVAEVGSLSVSTKMAKENFVTLVYILYAIFATNSSFFAQNHKFANSIKYNMQFIIIYHEIVHFLFKTPFCPKSSKK